MQAEGRGRIGQHVREQRHSLQKEFFRLLVKLVYAFLLTTHGNNK